MYIVQKHVGETPLACIDRLFDRSKHTYTYAGRLDPLAEGLLLVLADEECKEAKTMHRLPKTYESSFIVGLATDSYDCLGRITHVASDIMAIENPVRRALRQIQGSMTLPYPPYSSKTVGGVPLHRHARAGTLASISIPTTTMTVFSLTVLEEGWVSLSSVRRQAERSIRLVQGDFRQDEILNDWSTVQDMPVYRVSVRLSVSSGTYIRSLVHAIGSHIGIPTVTTHINRIAIGSFDTPCC